MKALRYIVLSCLFVLGCTELEVEESLPRLDNLTPSTLPTSLPVFNLHVEQDSFDYMYVRYFRDIRISARVDFYAEGTKTFEGKPAHIEIKGRSSSRADMKSLGITFREPLPDPAMHVFGDQELLGEHSLHSFLAFRLRNSGNEFGKTMLKDLAYTQLALESGLDVELRYGRPVHAFINDTYYGLLNVRSDIDRPGLSGLLGVDTNRITLLKTDPDNGNLEFEEGNAVLAQNMRDALKEENLETLHSLLDLDNFIDYLVFQDYIGNSDWPHGNVAAYSINGAPFRFVLFDLDFAAFRTKNALLPEMEFREDDLSRIYQVLFEQDEAFRNRLESRQKELYALLNPNRFNRILEERASAIEEEVSYLIARYRQPASSLHWRLELETLKRDFERRDFYMRRKYNIK